MYRPACIVSISRRLPSDRSFVRTYLSQAYKEADDWLDRIKHPIRNKFNLVAEINKNLLVSGKVDFFNLEVYVDNLETKKEIEETKHLLATIRLRCDDPSQLRQATMESFLKHCLHNDLHSFALSVIAHKDVFMFNPSCHVYNILMDWFLENDHLKWAVETVAEAYKQDEIYSSPICGLLSRYIGIRAYSEGFDIPDDATRTCISLGLAETGLRSNSSLHQSSVIIGYSVGDQPYKAIDYILSNDHAKPLNVDSRCLSEMDSSLSRREAVVAQQLTHETLTPEQVEMDNFILLDRKSPRVEFERYKDLYANGAREKLRRCTEELNLVDMALRELDSVEAVEKHDLESNKGLYVKYLAEKRMLALFKDGRLAKDNDPMRSYVSSVGSLAKFPVKGAVQL